MPVQDCEPERVRSVTARSAGSEPARLKVLGNAFDLVAASVPTPV